MKRNDGFTLIELLVVIAIISILAGIVIPNVPKYINKARATRAYAEIKGVDLALTKMLTDAGRSDFKSGFFDCWPGDVEDCGLWSQTGKEYVNDQIDLYHTVFYLLLRKGKYADSDLDWPGDVVLNEEVRRKLGDSYMDLGRDPWGDLYNFYGGPYTPKHNDDYYIGDGGKILVPFRTYQVTNSVPGGISADEITKTVLDPDSDPNSPGSSFDVGYPAPRKSTQFVWSNGKNRRSNQEFNDGYYGPATEVGLDFMGGGDDINNWDGDQSWIGFYN